MKFLYVVSNESSTVPFNNSVSGDIITNFATTIIPSLSVSDYLFLRIMSMYIDSSKNASCDFFCGY